jgi:hypothetical protein
MGYISEVAKAWLGIDNTHLDVDDAELELFIACSKKPQNAAKIIVAVLKEVDLQNVEGNEELMDRIICGPIFALRQDFPVVTADVFQHLLAENPAYAVPIRIFIRALRCK